MRTIAPLVRFLNEPLVGAQTVSRTARMSKTSLVEAVKQFDLEQVRKDLRQNPELKTFRTDRGFDLLLRGTEGKPALARRRVKTVEEFFRLGADPNVSDHRGETVLHLAFDRGCDVSFFKLLLRHGANPDLAGKDGRAVREIASRKRDKAYIDAIAGRRV